MIWEINLEYIRKWYAEISLEVHLGMEEMKECRAHIWVWHYHRPDFTMNSWTPLLSLDIGFYVSEMKELALDNP